MQGTNPSPPENTGSGWWRKTINATSWACDTTMEILYHPVTHSGSAAVATAYGASHLATGALTYLGFTSSGIAAGSVVAASQSVAATGGVAATGPFGVGVACIVGTILCQRYGMFGGKNTNASEERLVL